MTQGRVWQIFQGFLKFSGSLGILRSGVSFFGFQVSGFKFRVPSFGSRVSDFKFRVPSFGSRVSGLGYQIDLLRQELPRRRDFRELDALRGLLLCALAVPVRVRFLDPDFGFGFSGIGLRVLGSVFRVAGFRLRVSGFGFRISGCGLRV